MAMKILCFGDSNTFGYDPRDVFASRYDANDRWPDILCRQTGWEVINAGQNGRQIPHRSFELANALPTIDSHRADLVIVMLGTNDLLEGEAPDAVAKRMETFLSRLSGEILLVSPPALQRGAWVGTDALVQRSRLLGSAYRTVADRLGIGFTDAALWNVELAFDGVHFTPAGHHRFSHQLLPLLTAAAGRKETPWDISP